MVLKSSRCLGYYCYKHIKKFPNLTESKILPLLISHPFTCSKTYIDLYFSDLKNLGFELDRLSENTLALRTLPYYLDGQFFNAQNLVQELIHYFQIESYSQNSNFCDLIENFFLFYLPKFSTLSVPWAFIQKMLNSFELPELMKEKIFIELNDQFFEEVFPSYEKK